VIRLSPLHQTAINAHGEDAYPGECCGLLVGRVDVDGTVSVTRTIPSPNVVSPHGNDRFEVDPQVRFDLMRELHGTAETIIGHYHSHPDQTAEPSPTDLEMAFEPDLIWLIIAVFNGRAKNTRAWHLNRDLGTKLEVSIAHTESA
jgi:proteasome lid subunit RPN8/RPN11